MISTVFVLLLLASLTILIVGLVKPSFFTRVFNGQPSRKKFGLVFGVTSLVLFILVGITSSNSVKNARQGFEEEKKAVTQTEQTPNTTKIKGTQAKVVSVVDGDTIQVLIDDKKEVVRLIGMNSPELVDPRKPVECFGKEASDKAKQVLTGTTVSLEPDSTQSERDKYNRLLRYVWLENNTNFNKLMIAEGYAYEYTYDAPYKYQSEFKQAQREAEASKFGLWADNACSTSIPQPSSTKTSGASPATTGGSSGTTGGSSSGFTCAGKTLCGQMTSCAEAQFYLNTCGVSRLDADKDGVPCETICK